MSSGSQKRNRLTLALGAMSAVAFSGFYGLIASHAPASNTTAADPQVLTLGSTNVSQAVTAATAAAVSVEGAAPAATVAPTAEPTTVPTATPAASTTITTTHAQTRGS